MTRLGRVYKTEILVEADERERKQKGMSIEEPEKKKDQGWRDIAVQ